MKCPPALSPFLVAVLSSCHARSKAEATPGPPPSASARPAPSVPIPAEELRKALNPAGEKEYSGPVGSVRGVVRVSGDAPPTLPMKDLPTGRCDDARAFYGKAFREGPGRELGDVLVAVTGYKGYVPVQESSTKVVMRGCALQSRTIAMVFGQGLDVQNRGGEAFMPRLVGSDQVALVVALPGGDPVRLFPSHVGRYLLDDASHGYVRADVFVLKFPTFAVTGIDGKFEIKGIPVGQVTVSAHLPITQKTVDQQVSIVAGEAKEIELTIPFDKSTFVAPATQ